MEGDTVKRIERQDRADYTIKCVSCGATPTVVLTKNGKDREKTELCGPCYFGEAACADPDEWAT